MNYKTLSKKIVPTLQGAECDNHHDRRAVFSFIAQYDSPLGAELIELCKECKADYDLQMTNGEGDK